MQRMNGKTISFRAAFTRLLLKFALVAACANAPAAAHAQSDLFAPAIRVGDRVVTVFDLQQRTSFLTLLNAGPNAAETAREQLTNEALQRIAAERDAIALDPAAIIEAQTAFAAQGNLTREQFITALGQNGVEEGTFRDLIVSGLLWRETVRERFAPQVEVTEADVDRALQRFPVEAGVRVEIAEIVLPAADPLSEAASLARANRIRTSTDEEDFANAARLFSIAPTRLQGGAVGWRPVEALPPEAAAEIVRLAPGQITRPAKLGSNLAIFQLRDRETVPAGTVGSAAVDYAEVLIPGGNSTAARTEAARIAARARTCDDLFGVARGVPGVRLNRQTVPLTQLPGDVAREITGLDDREFSTRIVRGNDLVFLMLCARTQRASGTVDRALVRGGLTNQRLETFATGYLNELRLGIEIETLR